MSKGIPQTIVVVIIIIIIILLVYIFRDSYSRNKSDFGTWSDFSTSICLNENQACTVSGTAQRLRSCTPNTTTGFGCLDSNGKHTFRQEIITSECTPVCNSSVWSPVSETPCAVYDDTNGDTLSASQLCRDPTQFTLAKVSRVCVVKDPTGTNACIKTNGQTASVGEIEQIVNPCGDIDDCFLGTWQACPAPQNQLSDNCGGPVGDCGRVIVSQVNASCIQNILGVPTEVDPSNCFPPDDPGPCPRWCFNYPCTTYPAGFANIASLLGMFLELFDDVSGDALEPAWNHVVIACNPNPIDTIISMTTITINTPAAHTMLLGQIVDISGVSGGTVNGIPISEINGLRLITGVGATSIDIIVTTPATSTGSDGGIGIGLEQDPEASAIALTDVIFAYSPIVIGFGSNGLGFRVRFRIIPSQAEVANGAFYMVAHLPHNGQTAIVSWNGSALELGPTPSITLTETYDDVLPRPDLFTFSEASTPQTLNLYTLPGPVETDLFCVVPCIGISVCIENIDSVTDICV